MTDEEITNVEEDEDILEDTDVIIDDNPPKITRTPVYTFHITGHTLHGDYGVTGSILKWLSDNLSGLKDDDLEKIFGKVNTGFNENILKTFGKKPVCDVYIRNVEYDGTFEHHVPVKVNTIVLFYMKGANNKTYCSACNLHDLLVQEFVNNNAWKRSDVVNDTIITNSEVRIQTIRGGMGVMGAIELSHTLYRIKKITS